MLPEDLRVSLEREVSPARKVSLGAAQAYEMAVRLYPKELIDHRDGAGIIARGDEPKAWGRDRRR